MDNISHIYSMKYWCSSPYLIQNVVDSFSFVSFQTNRYAWAYIQSISSPLSLFTPIGHSITIPITMLLIFFFFLLSLLYCTLWNHNTHWDAILYSLFSIFIFCQFHYAKTSLGSCTLCYSVCRSQQKMHVSLNCSSNLFIPYIHVCVWIYLDGWIVVYGIWFVKSKSH